MHVLSGEDANPAWIATPLVPTRGSGNTAGHNTEGSPSQESSGQPVEPPQKHDRPNNLTENKTGPQNKTPLPIFSKKNLKIRPQKRPPSGFQEDKRDIAPKTVKMTQKWLIVRLFDFFPDQTC